MTTKRALVSGRILKKSGLVIMRGPHATSTTSTARQWEGSLPTALFVGAQNLITHSRGIDAPSDYKLNGELRA